MQLTPVVPAALGITPGLVTQGLVIYNLASYGARGDGVIDDTVSLRAALADAAVSGGIVWSQPGKTYLVSSSIVVSLVCTIDLSGSTIKKASTMTDYAIKVTGNGVTMRRVVVDGNKAAGATSGGIKWTGNGGVAEAVEANTTNNVGFYVNGGTVDFYRCKAQTNDQHGWQVDTAGVARLFGPCYAANNVGRGVLIAATAGLDCHVDLRSTGNFAAVDARSDRGTSSMVLSDHEAHYGVYLVGATRWRFSTVIVAYPGINDVTPSAGDGSGCPVFLQGAKFCRFGVIIAHGHPGYGVALSSNPDNTPGTESTHNRFSVVSIDATDSNNGSDPGISLLCGSAYNHFGSVYVRGHSAGCRIGEGFRPKANNRNHIEELYADACSAGAFLVDAGSYNTVGQIISRDTFTQFNARGEKGIVNFFQDDAPVTGSITAGTNLLTLSSTNGASIGTKYSVGEAIKVVGAGVSSADLVTVIDAINGLVATTRDNASTSVAGAAVTQQQLSTTGSIVSGSKTLTISSSAGTDGFEVGMGIVVTGAGAASADLATSIESISGTTFTLHDAAGTTVTTVSVKSLGAYGNIVRWVDHQSAPGTTKPLYIVYADATSGNNLVLDGISHGDYQTADVSLAGTGNKVSPPIATSGSLR